MNPGFLTMQFILSLAREPRKLRRFDAKQSQQSQLLQYLVEVDILTPSWIHF